MTSAIGEALAIESSRGGKHAKAGLVSLRAGTIWKLRLQSLLGRLFLLPLGAIMVYLIRGKYGLKIRDHARLRHQFRDFTKDRTPLIICANHLTLVDSVVILWALQSIPSYFVNYRLFSWNIPARENYCHKPIWKLVTYLNKCIPIDRQGPSVHIESVLAKISYLLSRGDVCLIFPEGTRSRSGRVDIEGAGYGIGKLIRNLPGCRVLCLYQRGATQANYSDFPKKGETFDVAIELISPRSDFTGLRAVRDYSVQVLSKLKEMEDRYYRVASATVDR